MWLPMTTTDWIQAGASIASVVVALVIGAVALRVAARSNGIAKDAVRVAEEAREISRDAVHETRRVAILGSVPDLFASRPNPHGDPPVRLNVEVANSGPTVAYGVLVSVAGAAERSLDAIDETTRAWSGRQVALRPGSNPLELVIRSGRPAEFPWMHLRLEYVSPLGAHIRHDYLSPAESRDRRHRLHRVTIDPRDGSEPIEFDIELGPFDDEPDLRPLPRVL
jgi:hypothetical protein